MTDKEKIRREVQRLMDELIQEQKNGYGYDADYACILELQNVLTYIDSLQEKPVSEELNEAAIDYAESVDYRGFSNAPWNFVQDVFKAGAKWQKANLWKPADGDDLPEIDREVVVFTQIFPDDAGMMSVAIGHRPNPEGYDGKSLSTGKVKHYMPHRYGKGGWNIPDVVLWLDLDIPKL